jgi:antitoxin (DNA-binding transcriptional repressor) of toxin-antitoxin stability system
MKKIELKQATNSLAQYARELEKEPLILTEGGHAVAALVPFEDGDVESIALGLNPTFNAIIERAREEYRNGASVSAEDVRRELGIS